MDVFATALPSLSVRSAVVARSCQAIGETPSGDDTFCEAHARRAMSIVVDASVRMLAATFLASHHSPNLVQALVPSACGFAESLDTARRTTASGAQRNYQGPSFRVGCQAGAVRAEASPRTVLRRRAAFGA